jgi:RNA polymerase sigma factor (sigma-70 family)
VPRPPQSDVLSTIAAPSAYEQHRDYVLNVLGRRCGWLDAADREAILHDAFMVFLEKERDETLDPASMNEHQVRAYLTQTALNKALREGDKAHRKRSVALEDGGLEVANSEPDADVLLAQDYDGARLREIVADLPERQQTVVKLRFFFDRTPTEIQSFLGVTERAYRRDLERAMRTITERFEQVRDGTFCESRRSLILAYVTGIAGPNRARTAREHLASCTACAHWAVQLRETARQAGAFVPMPVLTGAMAERSHRFGGIGHQFGVVRDRLADLATSAREQATGMAVRGDPTTGTLLGNLRPGAALAAVTSCLALGSGATYCAINGVPGPVRDLIGGSEQKTTPRQSRAPQRRAANVTASSTPAKTRTTARSSAASQPQSKQSRQRAKAKQTERKTSSEFGIEGSGATSQAPAASTGASTAPSQSQQNFSSTFGP